MTAALESRRSAATARAGARTPEGLSVKRSPDGRQLFVVFRNRGSRLKARKTRKIW